MPRPRAGSGQQDHRHRGAHIAVAVTGATGPFGRHALQSLLARGVPAAELVAVVRRPVAAQDLGLPGVAVRVAAYEDRDALRTAVQGVDRLLLVSGSEVGSRVAQHGSVLAAAAEAGVGFVAYTSILRAGTTRLLLAQEHAWTERALADSALPHALLRNGWYVENYTAQVPAYLEHGVVGAAGQGRVSAAARADLAEAAAVVVAGGAPGVHELGGEAFTLAELAQAVSAASGRDVPYVDLPLQDYRAVLVGAGVPEPLADVLVDADRGLAEGELETGSGPLAALLGRPVAPWRDAVTAAVAAALSRARVTS